MNTSHYFCIISILHYNGDHYVHMYCMISDNQWPPLQKLVTTYNTSRCTIFFHKKIMLLQYTNALNKNPSVNWYSCSPTGKTYRCSWEFPGKENLVNYQPFMPCRSMWPRHQAFMYNNRTCTPYHVTCHITVVEQNLYSLTCSI